MVCPYFQSPTQIYISSCLFLCPQKNVWYYAKMVILCGRYTPMYSIYNSFNTWLLGCNKQLKSVMHKQQIYVFISSKFSATSSTVLFTHSFTWLTLSFSYSPHLSFALFPHWKCVFVYVCMRICVQTWPQGTNEFSTISINTFWCCQTSAFTLLHKHNITSSNTLLA